MEHGASSRTYWGIWLVLLVLTLFMLLIEEASLPGVITILFLVGAMLTKAGLIGGWFMHLRFERAALVVCVVIGTLATALALFVLIAPDGVSMLRLAPK
ncbi:MAG: cytochrome C oxidase subunit IV family protein [Gemmatimonadales bacterium]